MDGFINVLKPPGMSSHDVVGFVRKILGMKRVGHAGTLDPGAAGVLPVAVGRAARLIEYLAAADKSYRVEMSLGTSTDSGDDTGKVVASMQDFVMPSEQELSLALKQLTGCITQVPPVYSAIKIKGKRACDLKRRNIEVDLPGRKVIIHRLELLQKRKNTLLLDVDCSKGTYIRSICTDLGAMLHIPATMSFLVRMRVGSFSLDDAWTLEELQEQPEASLLRPDGCLSHIPEYFLAEQRIGPFQNGLSTHDANAHFTEEHLRVYGRGAFLGIARFDKEAQCIVPEKVLL